MAASVTANGRSVVHKGSEGTSIAFPDVCLTRHKETVIPVPYPNIGKSADIANGARTVKADGHPLGHEDSFFSSSTGDEAGNEKGLVSGSLQGKAEFVSFSFDVSVEGRSVVRSMDQMVHNNKNTLPVPLLQPNPGIRPEENEKASPARLTDHKRLKRVLKNVALETVSFKKSSLKHHTRYKKAVDEGSPKHQA